MHYLYEREDGGVSVAHLLDDLIPDDILAKNPMTLSGMENGEFIYSRVVDWRLLLPGELPPDEPFRDAWTMQNLGPVTIDMPKAREIQKSRMRVARAPLLAALDIEYQRADEQGDMAEKARIAARKQALRDVTDDPRIEAARTPGDLAAVWPAALTP